MTKEAIVRISQENFPYAIAALLSGSQYQAEVMNPISDIDVVIIDTAHVHPTGKMMVIDSFRFDFTIIPACGIANNLLDDASSPRGILLHHFIQSSVLFDELGILPPLQEYAYHLYQRPGPLLYHRTENNRIELLKLRNKLNDGLSESAKLFSFCQIINKLSSLEISRLKFWEARAVHQAKALEELHPAFAQACIDVFNAYSKHTDLNPLIHFVDTYIRTYSIDPGEQEYMIVNVNIPHIAASAFLQRLPNIFSSVPLLHHSFKYGYISPSRYKKLHKYDTNLVFQTNGTPIKNIIDSLVSQGIVSHRPKPNYQIALGLEKGQLDIQGRCQFKEMLFSLFFSNPIDKTDIQLLTAILLKRLSDYLGLQGGDQLKLNALLVHRYILSVEEQSAESNHHKLNRLVSRKKNAFASEGKQVLKQSRKQFSTLFQSNNVHTYTAYLQQMLPLKGMPYSCQEIDSIIFQSFGLPINASVNAYFYVAQDILDIAVMPDSGKALAVMLSENIMEE